MESRIRWKVYVRFGGELPETCYSNITRRRVLLLRIDPFEYLADVYDRLHDCTAAELIQLVPSNWKPVKERLLFD